MPCQNVFLASPLAAIMRPLWPAFGILVFVSVLVLDDVLDFGLGTETLYLTR